MRILCKAIMKKRHINSISCGQGAPSVFLIWLAGQGLFPCDVVIVADTGNENDMLWSNGRRTDARTFFNGVTKPLAEKNGMDAAFVRAVDKSKQPIPALHLDQRYNDKVEIDMPLFGSNGGRLRQSCTDKWKKRAIKQELRRRGAKTATVRLGLMVDELHRVKQSKTIWETLDWPLVMTLREGGKRGWRRGEIQAEMKRLNIPYVVRSQCDYCPHKNLFRWRTSSPETVQAAADWENEVGKGDFYLTSHRIPLFDAIDLMESRQSIGMFDACDSGFCFT